MGLTLSTNVPVISDIRILQPSHGVIFDEIATFNEHRIWHFNRIYAKWLIFAGDRIWLI